MSTAMSPNAGSITVRTMMPVTMTNGVETMNGAPNAKNRRSWVMSLIARDSSCPDSQEPCTPIDRYWRRS